jgi:hypothetical protein
MTLCCSVEFWSLATHADPHMLHLALVSILFLLLLVWDSQRHAGDPELLRHADRWLVAATVVYGVAVANHSLALLLPPAIGLFVLAADWRVILRWRTLAACAGGLAIIVVVLFSELPIRAAMNAPLVYGHPDTLSGFSYVVLAEQFRGSLSDPFGDLPTKMSGVVDLLSGWLGPVGILAVVGFFTSLVRRPRYVLLSGLAALATAIFSASYANADINRYYLVPLFVACTWIGLAAADAVDLAVWVIRWGVFGQPAAGLAGAVDAPGAADQTEAQAVEPAGAAVNRRAAGSGSGFLVLLSDLAPAVLEGIVALALILGPFSVVADRQLPSLAGNPGGVSEADQTYDETWVKAMLAPADQGGLPQNSVIVSWWSTSTTLWYGQKVLGLRPDIFIVDDRTRLDDNLGEVQDVFNKFLGNRPLFTIRLDGGPDGMVALSSEYDIQTYKLGSGVTIAQVVGRKGT